MEPNKTGSDPTIERDLGALLSAGFLHLKNGFSPRMDAPVTNKRSHTLKQVMRNMADKKSSFSFLVDDSHQLRTWFAHIERYDHPLCSTMHRFKYPW